MFDTIKQTIPYDRDYPARAYDQLIMQAVLNGTLYDRLDYEFHTEKSDAGEYIPIRKRKPSVRYGICRTVVDDSVSLLFSEGHFPTAQCEDKPTAEALQALVRETRLDDVMINAAIKGSVGSVAVLFRVLKSRVFFDVMTTEYLTPVWQIDAPDTLERVTERYKVKGETLKAMGYHIADADLTAWHWFHREWDNSDETWFAPAKLSDVANDKYRPVIDRSRSVNHALGFVPVVWIRNLPGGNEIDGACTFRPAIDASIEIDYQLSQAGRGLKYSSDPTLVIKEPASPDGDIVKGAGNALILTQEGDAKLLEIGGTASAAVIEYVKQLRELALESIHGNRSEASKLSAAQSGRAMELMNQGLIWLADRLRAAYGEHGLLPLLRMAVAASTKAALLIDGKPAKLSADKPITLKWPRWYAPTAEDRQQDASTLVALNNGGLISRQTAIGRLADDYDIDDVAAEMALIDAERKAEDARLIAIAAQTKATTNVAS